MAEIKQLQEEKAEFKSSLERSNSKLKEVEKELNHLKQKTEVEITRLEKRNQDYQDLLAQNPNTRPVMIEKSMERVTESFTMLETIFGVDQKNFEKINELETELEEAQNLLETTKIDLQSQINLLKEQLLNTKEIVALELSFKFEDEKQTLKESFQEISSKFDKEIEHLKIVIAEKEIDQSRFTELNKTLNEQKDISKEIDAIRESTKSQIQLKEDELDDLRGAIGHFQKALEESRMREMNAKS